MGYSSDERSYASPGPPPGGGGGHPAPPAPAKYSHTRSSQESRHIQEEPVLVRTQLDDTGEYMWLFDVAKERELVLAAGPGVVDITPAVLTVKHPGTPIPNLGPAPIFLPYCRGSN